MRKLISFVIITLFCSCQQETSEVSISSPNGKIKLAFQLEEGKPMYSVLYNNEILIKPSALGFKTKDSLNLYQDFRVISTENTSQDTLWIQPWGENKKIKDVHHQLKIHLKNKEEVELTLYFRVFDDGLGFRYQYHIPKAKKVEIIEELTEFALAKNGFSWSIPASFDTYELNYRKQQISALTDANTPITFKFHSTLYASIHEAALTDFPEMTLRKKEGELLTLKSDLAAYPDGIRAKVKGDLVTPWRTLQLSETAVGLINSSLILNLNEPSKVKDTSWIHPVKYVGIWWGMHLGIQSWDMGKRHGATTENALKYIDFASENNIQAVLFEGWNKGWENWGTSQKFNFRSPYSDFNIWKIAKYAQEKNIQIIGHHETGGNIRNYERQLNRAFAWYKKLGINIVKTGYAGAISNGETHHGQYMVNHYRKVVETAVKYQIMLNVHEPIKPTGIRRTYPNMMTREGVKGMEWNAWSEGNALEHTEILPFTRMLAGPIDYTPGIFDILFDTANQSPDREKWNDLDPGNTREHTTLSKQIANWVILYSPMQMASDLIEHYDHPAFQFFRDYDADCDWSQALQGEPGEFVVIVRKAKDKFFLGATTNQSTRSLRVSLSFLEKGKTYKATIYADDPKSHWQTNPLAYQIVEKEVTSDTELSIDMMPGGGQAIVFQMVE